MSTISPSPSLAELGWDDDWAAALALVSETNVEAGRVSRIDRGAMTILTASGPRRAATAGPAAVAVGDWVAVTATPAPEECSVIALLPRRFTFRRFREGPGKHEQLVAANCDTVLVIDAIDGQLSVRHLERYLTLACQSGATPVVVITKADLASSEQVDQRISAVKQVAPGVAVHVVSTDTGQGVRDLARFLAAGSAALVGLSGAGKSTLVNRLAEADLLATGEVRRDGKGRHTTTHRQLVPLASGGLIIDTPGMRALSITGAGDAVELAFADIEELATRCHFPDCSHSKERDCAVRAGIAAGSLHIDRVASWLRFREQAPSVNRDRDRVRLQDRKRRRATAKTDRRVLRNSKPQPQRPNPT